MKILSSKSFTANLNSEDKNIKNAWESFIRSLGKKEMGFLSKYLKSVDDTSMTTCFFSVYHYIDVVAVVKIFEETENEQQIELVKNGLCDLVWEMYKSTWVGWTKHQLIGDRAAENLQRCLKRDIFLEKMP